MIDTGFVVKGYIEEGVFRGEPVFGEAEEVGGVLVGENFDLFDFVSC